MSFKFYTAGKIWHAGRFQFMRDSLGLPVQARWIDLDNSSDLVQNRKNDLWQMCYEDVRDSDFVLLYSQDMTEEQRGALVEVGMAFGMNKPVYAVGRCNSISPNGISDVAFTHHHLWHWVEHPNLVKGTYYAIAHFLGNRAKLIKQKRTA